MQRLVYNPRAYVYTKRQDGSVLNISPWVVSGEVRRVIDQVSSATVTLRNPYKQFTTPASGVAFHPMDPITIYLERLAGFPVRVFTGYLDTTPYYQMYPGTITLQASCTLKKLLYTFFDPSLPYLIAFFEKYGWFNTGQGSLINPSALGGAQPLNNVNLQDSSIGKLLWATLYEIGEWQDTNIYIEQLPLGIADRMAQLMNSLAASQQQAAQDFSAFLQSVIGAGSQGSGGGGNSTTGGIGATADVSKAIPAMIDAANNAGVPPLFVLAVSYNECTFSASSVNSFNVDECTGWFQFRFAPGHRSANPGASWAWYAPHATVNQARDPGYSAAAFCQACIQKGGPPSDPGQWNDFSFTNVQIAGTGGYPNWDANMPTVQGYYDQYKNAASTSSAQSSRTTKTQKGKTAPASSSSSISISNMFPGGATPERIDEGVDYTGAGKQIVCLSDSDVVSFQSNAYGPSPGNLLIMRFKDAPLSQGGCDNGLWYVSEMFNPTKTSGSFKAGDVIGTIIGGTGIEVGWWSSSIGNACGAPQVPTHDSGGPQTSAWGADFSNLVVASGGPPGITENPPVGGTTVNNWKNVLAGKATIVGSGGNSGGTTGGAAGSTTSTNTAQAFVAEINFPSIEDQVTAVALGAEHKGLMHDQQLLPFVQQLAQASMRSFQSLPNGDFYAFYPDYFGEFGQHNAYWDIDDLEILEGDIYLSDDSLATHVFAVGDNTWPINNEMMNMLFSAGSISVFNAFLDNDPNAQIIKTNNPFVTTATAPGGTIKGNSAALKGMEAIMTTDEAVQFIKRYGARPLVQNYPMVRSNLFEMLLAYQQFMMAWSNQFKTPFTFTFMPEIYPGGKVSFSKHGLQMYINSVTHSWNYAEGGFTTEAELTAPSLIGSPNDYPDLPANMVAALVEPIRNAPPGSGDQTQQLLRAQQDAYQYLAGTANKVVKGFNW